jgi:hypothetical protein
MKHWEPYSCDIRTDREDEKHDKLAGWFGTRDARNTNVHQLRTAWLRHSVHDTESTTDVIILLLFNKASSAILVVKLKPTRVRKEVVVTYLKTSIKRAAEYPKYDNPGRDVNQNMQQ